MSGMSLSELVIDLQKEISDLGKRNEELEIKLESRRLPYESGCNCAECEPYRKEISDLKKRNEELEIGYKDLKTINDIQDNQIKELRQKLSAYEEQIANTGKMFDDVRKNEREKVCDELLEIFHEETQRDIAERGYEIWNFRRIKHYIEQAREGKK